MRPIDPQLLHNLEANAWDLARAIDEGLTEARGRRTGFALLLFSFAGPELTWILNAPREEHDPGRRRPARALEGWDGGRAESAEGERMMVKFVVSHDLNRSNGSG